MGYILILFIIIKINISLFLTMESQKSVKENIQNILSRNNITYKLSGSALETIFEDKEEEKNISLSIYNIKNGEKEININNKDEAKNIIKEIKIF